MRKTFVKWKNLSKFFRAFLFVALAFLLIGVGTLGTTHGTGDSYEMQYKTSLDAKEPFVVFQLSAPKKKDDEGKEVAVTVRMKEVYLNLGAIYSDAAAAEIRLGRASSATSAKDGSFSTLLNAKIANPYSAEKAEGAVEDALFNWSTPFDMTKWNTSNITTYPYVALTARSCNLLVNEVVFVGEEYDGSEPTGNLWMIPAVVSEYSRIPYDSAKGETKEDALTRAGALVDSQHIPAQAQSSFFRYGQEEIDQLSNIAEMRMGTSYVAGDVYHGDRTYNALGMDVLALGTLIFGTSPFGLRFFPMLASFGILLVGYFFVKRLFKSDKAGLIFALLYALSGLSVGIAHIGAPVTIGLFFLVASLSACHRFYAEGMKKAKPASTLPLLASGICGALAVCVNGAFIIPVAGVAGLFAAGMVRQQKARRYHLDKAIAEAEAGETEEPVMQKSGDEPTGKEKVAAVVNEYRYKNTAAPLMFCVSLLVGIFVFSALFMLPASYAYVKLFFNPSSSVNIFTLAWKGFAAGFAGSAGAVWNPFYTTFAGSGEVFAVTAAVANTAALIAGLFGIAFAVYRLVVAAMKLKKEGDRSARAELRSIVVPLAGLILSLVTASFAGGALAFVFAAYVFAFILAAGGFHTLEGMGAKCAKAVKIVLITGLVLLILCFLLYAVFTFSIPLPASFISKFVA